MQLTREVRFFLGDSPPGGPVLNSWAGWPTGDAIAPFVVLRATVSGAVDQRTGYLCNITLLDRLLRERAIPSLQRAWSASAGRGLPAARSLADLWADLGDRSPNGTKLESLELRASPFLRFAAYAGELPMIVLTESFEFAASHRLYCPDLDDEKNREVFGKCANPNGHGHNYVVEVSVAGRPDPRSGTIVDHAAFERTVKERVIDRFDHKHLNADCPEFAELNPSVENITRVIWDLLSDRFTGSRLHSVRVWETAKTCAEYSGT
ncbi:MAG TPA: 6-carboxytetrahydropterin synthase [Phycisphaerae bacterium]|nr:6-carboxytetrahydropterin synthase [Phycisphaerae bacterium]